MENLPNVWAQVPSKNNLDALSPSQRCKSQWKDYQKEVTGCNNKIKTLGLTEDLNLALARRALKAKQSKHRLDNEQIRLAHLKRENHSKR
jgi:hypothetical protein